MEWNKPSHISVEIAYTALYSSIFLTACEKQKLSRWVSISKLCCICHGLQPNLLTANASIDCRVTEISVVLCARKTC